MKFYSTRDVAKELGVRGDILQKAIWLEKIDKPEKGPGGAFFWTIDNMKRASWVLCKKAYEPKGD